ncbi:MAG: hypothetical protein C4584_00210 [Armatimonadetes bacterium]|nr:MAG: hypothetical protein C4584_00210 [Armatimonadota bacterium]
MPSKNIIKTYVEDGYYHIYNRGVEKRQIFLDEQDCKVFLHYLRLYLSPKEELLKTPNITKRLDKFILKNLSQEIDLLCFTLMPNHIHLLVKQYTTEGMAKLMKRLSVAYVAYFNKKHKRIGHLFQDTYKAALITKDPYLLHLTRYIHLNSKDLSTNINFLEFSSYPYYLGEKSASWIKPQEILKHFNNNKQSPNYNQFSYKSFVEDYKKDSKEILGGLILEED